MNYKMIVYTLGWVMIFEAACLLLPMICAAIYGEKCIVAFIITSLISLTLGVLFKFKTPKNKTLHSKEGFLTVALTWIVISIIGALPFVISGEIKNITDAVFETVSGFTTTGASILTDVEVIPKSLLFWRSFTHWIGGMGVIVLLVALLPLSGGNNMYLMKAESPGPSVSKLVPKVRSTAKILYSVYIFLTLTEVVLLLIGKLPLFDALTLSFGTAGTGGFGILNSSIGDYSSYVQIVITVFMLIFAIDFSFYYLILIRKFSLAIKSEEVRWFIAIVVSSIIMICINCRAMFETLGETVKHSAFQVASIISTTGYATTDFDLWPSFSKTIIVLLMFIGACAGSTGGGMKVSRIIILCKTIAKEIKIVAMPRSTHKIKMNSRPVEHEVVRAVNVYFASYMLIFAASLLVISIDNFDFTTNFTAVLSAISNIGPGFAKVGPTQNFAGYSTLSTIVLTFDMLVGRLEIFPVLILFSPKTWKK